MRRLFFGTDTTGNQMASSSGDVSVVDGSTPDGEISVPRSLVISLVLRKLKWNDEDLAMEVGCGSGADALHRIIPAMKQFKKYFVIDSDPTIIESEQSKCPIENVEYHVADIEILSTFKEEWLGKMTKFISTNVFHCLKTSVTQRPAFENVLNLLTRGGEAVFLFVIWHPYWEVDFEIREMKKWEHHQGILPGIKWTLRIDEDEYRKILTKMGFEVLSCENNYAATAYEEILKLKESYTDYCSRFLPPLPDAIREDLMNDRFRCLLRHAETEPDGEMRLNFNLLSLHVRKSSKAKVFL